MKEKETLKSNIQADSMEKVENNLKEIARAVSVLVCLLWIPDEQWGVEVLPAVPFSSSNEGISVSFECRA